MRNSTVDECAVEERDSIYIYIYILYTSKYIYKCLCTKQGDQGVWFCFRWTGRGHAI